MLEYYPFKYLGGSSHPPAEYPPGVIDYNDSSRGQNILPVDSSSVFIATWAFTVSSLGSANLTKTTAIAVKTKAMVVNLILMAMRADCRLDLPFEAKIKVINQKFSHVINIEIHIRIEYMIAAVLGYQLYSVFG